MLVIHLARKPCSEPTLVQNVLKYGCGGINIDGCRIIGLLEGDPNRFVKTDGGEFVMAFKSAPIVRADGRWPANLILQHLPGCQQVGTRLVPGTRIETPSDCQTHTGAGSWGTLQGNRPARGYGDPETGKEAIEAWACLPDCPVQVLDDLGDRPSRSLIGAARHTLGGNGLTHGKMTGVLGRGYDDSGGASRYFKQVGGTRKTP